MVQYLISKGMPPQRLVAAGFGEFQPIDPGNTEEAYARNPRGPPSYRIAMSLHAYMQGDYRKAAEEALKVDKLTTIYPHTALAMAYAQLGEKDKAAAEVNEILKIDPGYGDHVVEDLEKRNVDRSIIAAILEGLAKAGMTGASFKQ